MHATGFGTIESDTTQDAQGFGAWRDGSWRIVISFPRRQPRFTLDKGMRVPTTFAVWDGSRSERNGQKAFSDWQDMLLTMPDEITPTPITPTPEEEIGGKGIVPIVLGGVGGAVAVAVAALIGLRIRGQRGRQQH